MWTLYVRVSTQWRSAFAGATGLDYGPAVRLIEARGWDLERALDLLRAVEAEELDWMGREREKPSQG